MSESITVTNHTKSPVQFTTVQDSSVADVDRKKIHTIDPKESLVIFMDRVEALQWEKCNKQG